MTLKQFRIGYIVPPMYPTFRTILKQAPNIVLVALEPNAPVKKNISILSSCHGYYVKASRDELPLPLHVTKELLKALSSLLVVGSYASGYDTVDVAACTAAGVAVFNQSGGNAEAVAEHAVGMILSLSKRIPEGHSAIVHGRVTVREAFMGYEIAGKTVGIVGLGKIGSRVAAIVQAFGCRVLAFDPYLTAEDCNLRMATKVEFTELLTRSDIITLHCPLNNETRGMFNLTAFEAMRQGTIFVNTARGSICDENALEAAVSSFHLRGVGLDVWEHEPPPMDHPLLKYSSVIATPHIAGVAHEARDRVAQMAAKAFISVAAGNLPPRLLNPEVSDYHLLRRKSLAI